MAATVLVTGGAGGIGAAIGRRLVADGFDVVLTDRAGSTGDRAGATGVRELDVCDTAAVDALVGDVARGPGGLHGVVLSHGLGGRIAPLADYTDAEAQAILAVNLTGSISVIRAAVRHLVPRGGGRIVAVASAAAKEGNPGSAVYSASKAGLLGLVKSVAREVATDGVLVNAVAPGPTQTPMLAHDPGLADYLVSRTPMGRLAQPEEVAAAVAWLLSADCTFTTGSCLDLSGGRSAY